MTDTAVEETTEENTTPAETSSEATDESGETKEQSRDFTKTRPNHDELTAFINAHPEYQKAELADLTPGQVKAVLALRADFNKLPEQVAARAKRKEELAAEKSKYDGMSPEQIKAAKAADRADKAAETAKRKAEEAVAKAEALRAQATGSIAEAVAAEPVAEEVAAEPVTDDEVVETPASRPRKPRR